VKMPKGKKKKNKNWRAVIFKNEGENQTE